MALENKIKWKLAPRVYCNKIRKATLVVTHSHPLQTINEIALKNATNVPKSNSEDGLRVTSMKQEFVDPLSSMLDGTDPLSCPPSFDHPRGGADNPVYDGMTTLKQNKPTDDVISINKRADESWEMLMSELSKFTTKQKLTFGSAFYSCDGCSISKCQNNLSDRARLSGKTSVERVKARLEHFNSLDEGGVESSGSREAHGWTPDEFCQHLLDFKEEMKEAWGKEHRVQTLKVAIQGVKVLALSAPEIFYPCKFVHVTGLLDSLGDLVHSRLIQLIRGSQSSAFCTGKDEALDTARNWFQKVSSMRELLPRIYLEAALLPCYDILPAEESSDVLGRLILMCRGIGDPIVGSYARLYVTKAGLKFRGGETRHIKSTVEDIVISCEWGWNGAGVEDINVEGEGLDRGGVAAERVFVPVLQWMMRSLIGSEVDCQWALELCSHTKGIIQYILLKSVLKAFPARLLEAHCLVLLQILDNCFAQGEEPQECLITLATDLTGDSLLETNKANILIGVWPIIQRLRPIQDYVKVTASWMHFIARHFDINEVDKVLSDVLKRLSKHTASSSSPIPSYGVVSYNTMASSTSFYPKLLSLLTTTLASYSDSEELYALSSFRGLISVFQRESGTCVGLGTVTEMKKLLVVILEHHQGAFSDPEAVSILLSLFGTLHRGINALTTQDERRLVHQLVNAFVLRVSFGKDYERQLEFYVEARGLFTGLDPVLESLVQHVLRLQVGALDIVNGRHTGRTAAFERACSAYCFITIPSLSCPLTKLNLYVISAAVAMVNNCMGQGDACIKSAIKTILDISSEVKESPTTSLSITYDELTSSIINMIGYLVALPDPPDASKPLYLFRGLFNGLRVLAGVVDGVSSCKMFLALFKAVCAVAQDILPYRLKNVEGIDTLYGGDCTLIREAENLGLDVLSTIVTLLGGNGKMGPAAPLQLDLLCGLVNAILTYGDICDAEVKSTASFLLAIVIEHSPNIGVKKELEAKFDLRCA